jgi:hypothetical protein
MNRLTPAHHHHHHHGAMPPPAGTGQLARYGSAPGSLLAAIAESVTRGDPHPPPPPVSRFYSAESSGLTSCESTCRTDGGGGRPLERAYGGSGEIRVPPPPLQHHHQHHHHHQQQQQSLAPPTHGLLRHSSSPAGLLSRLMADPHGTTRLAPSPPLPSPPPPSPAALPRRPSDSIAFFAWFACAYAAGFLAGSPARVVHARSQEDDDGSRLERDSRAPSSLCLLAGARLAAHLLLVQLVA